MRKEIILLALLACSICVAEESQGNERSQNSTSRPESSRPPSSDPGPSSSSSSSSSQGAEGDAQVQHIKPRGDDPRTRNWGFTNERNEIEFDDPKSPRKVAVIGKSAHLRIYPNYSDTSVYLTMKFADVAEIDASGKIVIQHAIASLADDAAIEYVVGNETSAGVTVSYVKVTLDPTASASFSACPSSPSSSSPLPPSSPPSSPLPPSPLPPSPLPPSPLPPSTPPPSPPPPSPPAGPAARRSRALLQLQDTYVSAPLVTVTLWFGSDGVLKIPYGNNTVVLPRNGLKWTVTSKDWPFCNVDNALSVALQLTLSSNGKANVSEADGASGAKVLSLVLNKDYNSSIAFYTYALDAANGNIVMPVTYTVKTSENVVNLNMIFPNPKRYNTTTVVYDPMTVTTSAYLDASDTANADLASANFLQVAEGNVPTPPTPSSSPPPPTPSSSPPPPPEPTSATPMLRSSVWAALLGAVLSALWLGAA